MDTEQASKYVTFEFFKIYISISAYHHDSGIFLPGKNFAFAWRIVLLKYFAENIFALVQVGGKYFPAKFNLLTLILTTCKIARCVAVDKCDKRMETIVIEKECCIRGYTTYNIWEAVVSSGSLL